MSEELGEKSQTVSAVELLRCIGKFHILDELRSTYKDFIFWAKKDEISEESLKKIQAVNARLAELLRSKSIILGKSNKLLIDSSTMREQDRCALVSLSESIGSETNFIIAQKKTIIDRY